MGFKRPQRTIVLEFEGDWDGAEVTCRRDVTIPRMREFEALSSGQVSDMETALRDFGDNVIISWNLEDDEGPITPSGEALLDWPVDFALAVLRGWLQGATTVDAPLVEGSRNGKSPAVPSVPMEAS